MSAISGVRWKVYAPLRVGSILKSHSYCYACSCLFWLLTFLFQGCKSEHNKKKSLRPDITGGNDHGLPLGKRHPNTYLHSLSTYTLSAVNERTREVWQSLTAYLGTVSLIAVHQILRWIDVGLCFAFNITFLFQHRCIEDSLPSLQLWQHFQQ